MFFAESYAMYNGSFEAYENCIFIPVVSDYRTISG
jgi:hypothetical protein